MNTTDKIMALADEYADLLSSPTGAFSGKARKKLHAEIEALVRDAERLDYLQKIARCDPKMDGKHVWWPTTFNQAQKLKGATLRDAIDAAMQEKQS